MGRHLKAPKVAHDPKEQRNNVLLGCIVFDRLDVRHEHATHTHTPMRQSVRTAMPIHDVYVRNVVQQSQIVNGGQRRMQLLGQECADLFAKDFRLGDVVQLVFVDHALFP